LIADDGMGVEMEVGGIKVPTSHKITLFNLCGVQSVPPAIPLSPSPAPVY